MRGSMWFHIYPWGETGPVDFCGIPLTLSSVQPPAVAGNGRTEANQAADMLCYRAEEESGARLESEDETKGIGTARSRVLSPS